MYHEFNLVHNRQETIFAIELAYRIQWPIQCNLRSSDNPLCGHRLALINNVFTLFLSVSFNFNSLLIITGGTKDVHL